MTVEESGPLLNFLFEHMQKHQFTCRFRWQPGATMIWDNRFTLHFPINDVCEHRVMLRSGTVESFERATNGNAL